MGTMGEGTGGSAYDSRVFVPSHPLLSPATSEGALTAAAFRGEASRQSVERTREWRRKVRVLRAGKLRNTAAA